MTSPRRAINEHEVKKLEHVVPENYEEPSRLYVSDASRREILIGFVRSRGMRSTDNFRVIVSAHIYTCVYIYVYVYIQYIRTL